MYLTDQYAWTNRWCHHHPVEKLLLAGGLLLLSMILPPLTTAPIVLLVVGLATVVGAGIPAATLGRFIAVPGTFLLIGIPFLALSVNSAEGIGFSLSGLETALRVVARSLAAIASMAFLTLTTPVVAWAPLLRRLGVPQVIVEIMLLIYRLIFVFAEQAVTTSQAQTARLGYNGIRRSFRSLGLLVAGLFGRSLAQMRRLEIGLAARNFDGEFRVLQPTYELSPWRLALIGGALLIVAIVGLLGSSLPAMAMN
ncbi:MAG: cobalt ECF transporter T component CbiQ [Candidatus Competibacteraceae bacterium]